MSPEERRAALRGDNAASAWGRGPEIIAAEQRILTYADGMLAWFRQVAQADPEFAARVDGFFTHESERNPLARADRTDDLAYEGETKHWLLDKMDPDANRHFMELMRAVWERRCWRAHYQEITNEERDTL